MSALRHLRQRGSVLLGVIILAALVLIGAATIGVIYVRQLNQQRQVQTQALVQTAFLGLFPGNLGKQANLFNDFGYRPVTTGAPYDLKLLVDFNALSDSYPAPAVAKFSGTLSQTTFNAWNGPYWSGPVDDQNRPVDAWGKPLQLRYITTTTPPGWQVFSFGQNGVSETGDVGVPPAGSDDLVYPNPPYQIPAPASAVQVCSSLTIPFSRTDGYNPAEDVTITLKWTVNGGGSTSIVVKFNNGFPEGTTATTFTNVPQDTITFTLYSTKRGDITPTADTFNLSSCTPPPTINF